MSHPIDPKATVVNPTDSLRNRRSPNPQERASVGVEVVILTVIDAELKVLLFKRPEHPFKGVWSLPGSLVHVSNSGNQGEGIEDAAHRVVFEATNIPKGTCSVDQIQTFGKAGRDPRMRLISVAWTALVSPNRARTIHPGSDGEAQWFSANEEVPWMRLSFDHAEILATAIEHIQRKVDHSHLAFELVPDTFTVAELRDAHEAIQSRTYDARNFRRRFQRLISDGVVAEAPGKRHRGKARPAKVWRFQG